MAQDVGKSAAEVRASRQSSCKPQGQSRSVELAQRMAHSGRPSRRRPAEHSKLAALFALVVLSVTPASADDLIEQWLKKDEASAQIVEARPDLNAPRMSSGTKSSSLGASNRTGRVCARNTDAHSPTLVSSSGCRVRDRDRRREGQELHAPPTKNAHNSAPDERSKLVAL